MNISVLNRIIEARRSSVDGEIVESSRELLEKQALDNTTLSLSKAILERPQISLIAEIKTASPSKGTIRKNIPIGTLAQIFSGAGACALSVLTEPDFFSGHWLYLRTAKKYADVPIMCKDFIIDEFQLLMARANGADAVLLIAAILDDTQLQDMITIAHELKMEVLTEAINEEELERVLASKTDLIGINNRNLHTLKVDLNLSYDLLKNLKDERPVIVESGIFERHDVVRLEKAGADGILVGTALMESDDIGKKVKELLGKTNYGL